MITLYIWYSHVLSLFSPFNYIIFFSWFFFLCLFNLAHNQRIKHYNELYSSEIFIWRIFFSSVLFLCSVFSVPLFIVLHIILLFVAISFQLLFLSLLKLLFTDHYVRQETTLIISLLKSLNTRFYFISILICFISFYYCLFQLPV